MSRKNVWLPSAGSQWRTWRPFKWLFAVEQYVWFASLDDEWILISMYLIGAKWKLSAADSQSNGHARGAAHLQPHEQVHVWLPEFGGRLRRGYVPRGESGTVHHHQLPVSVLAHVRRCRTRCFNGCVRFLDGAEREASCCEKDSERGIPVLNTQNRIDDTTVLIRSGSSALLVGTSCSSWVSSPSTLAWSTTTCSRSRSTSSARRTRRTWLTIRLRMNRTRCSSPTKWPATTARRRTHSAWIPFGSWPRTRSLIWTRTKWRSPSSSAWYTWRLVLFWASGTTGNLLFFS